MEKIQPKNNQKMNGGLVGKVQNAIKETLWKVKIRYLISTAKNDEDMNQIGKLINEAIDNNYNIDAWNYQVRAAKKDTKVDAKMEKYNKLGVEQ